MPISLSKSSFLAGCQCQKLLWKKLHDPDSFPPIDETRQASFDQGHLIGELARSLYPGGIEVGGGGVPAESAVAETATLLQRRVPLYEPAIAFGGGYARIDLLVPDPDDAWRIIEIKSSARVKDEHLLDVAFQLYLCRNAGLTVPRCAVMHVDSDYVRHGEIDPAQLFHEEDVTEQVTDLLASIPGLLADLLAVAGHETCPEIAIGGHCTKPYPCDLKPQCCAFLPAYPVTDLYRDSRGRRWDFLQNGITALADIPDPGVLNARQQRQVEAARSNAPQFDPAAIQAFLDTLTWPRAYFDIETSSSAIPLYDRTRPFQQVPFQFSLHVQEEKDGPIAHHEFLASGRDDPRPAFLDHLRTHLPTQGSVIAYNASFENRCLRNCAAAFPDHAWAADVPARTVDLLAPFRNFSYYHPDQHGSASIKNVLPALTDTSYSHLGIQDGSTAARAFATTEFTDLPANERERIRTDLLAYCQLDTQAMIDLVDALTALVAP